jgi:hypothetical protein
MLVWVLRLQKANTGLQAEADKLRRDLEEAIRRLALYETEPKSEAIAKMVDLLAPVGVPALVFFSAMAVSGFSGAAAITVALSSLGGPAGMLGGIGFLVTIGVLLAKYGVTDLSTAFVRRLLQMKSKDTIIREIDALPGFVPLQFRRKAKYFLET